MPLIKKNEFEEFGIRGKEASFLLRDIIVQNKGIHKKQGEGVFSLISMNLSRAKKRTINDRDDFENKAREIINRSKEKINNEDYLEVSEEILNLFRDEAKSKIRLYLKNNSIIILILLNFTTLVASTLSIIIRLLFAFHSS